MNPARLCPHLVVIAIHDLSRKLQGLDENECYLREGAARRLCRAAELLPEGHRMKIWEAHRPTRVQRQLFADYLTKLRKEHPEWPEKKLESETSLFVARPNKVAPHLCGGTVDLTVVGPDGEDLDMGTEYLLFDDRTPTGSDLVSKAAKGNRKLLAEAMSRAGFVNYELEWWHWSYGDRYWAFKLRKPAAIYVPT
ncbi:dipeptidase [Candidatus Fermentibacteria bacterium]|nr:dipeptidase [Candidatus Fermentibacteria bacterium]